jgi:hypothetical protein
MRILKSGAKSGPFLVLSELSCPCAQLEKGSALVGLGVVGRTFVL